MTQITPDMGGDYFQKVNKALNDFHKWNENSGYVTKIKPLYVLIKVDVDADIVHNQDKAEAYAENHCNNMEYALCDWYYPDSPQYPYIAK